MPLPMIRAAEIGDELQFRILFTEYLEDQLERGNDLVPDQKTMDFLTGMFEQYVTKALDGVVLLADDVGILMWGEMGKISPITNRYGRVAQGWGTYVRKDFREQGLSKRLRAIAMMELREMGFDAVMGAILVNASEAAEKSATKIGLEIYLRTGVIPLGA